MIDEQEDLALREWAQQQLDEAPAFAMPALPRRRSATRRWLPAAAAAVVVVAVSAGVLVLRHGDGDTPTSHPASKDVHLVLSGDARSAVVHDGDTVTGSGEIVAVPGQAVRFCASVPMPTVGSAGGPYNADDDCPVFVTVTGVDLHALADRQVVHGTVVIGSAILVGVYRQGRVSVTHQRAPGPDAPFSFDTVPCPAPSGGWPRTGSGNIDTDPLVAFQRSHPRDVVDIAQLNVSRSQHVGYVLTAGAPDPVRAALHETFTGPLCVVRSRFSARQLDQASRVVENRMEENGPHLPTDSEYLYMPYSGGGRSLDAKEQLVVPAEVPVLDDSFAAIVDAQAKGVVQLDVWLVPVRR